LRKFSNRLEELGWIASRSFATVSDVRAYEEYLILREDPTTNLYSIVTDGSEPAVKIGVSANPLFRLKCLQASCPIALRLLGSVRGTPAYERKVHRRLSDYHLRGEWFRFDGKAKRVAEAIASGNLQKVARLI